MDRPLVLEFTYSPEEYARALRFHYQQTLRIRFDLAAGVIGALAGIALWLGMDRQWAGLALLVPSCVLLLLIFLATVIIPPLAYRAQPKLLYPYRLVFTEHGIDFHTASVDAQLAWDLYTQWVESPEAFLLYYGKGAFSLIPKRVFQDRSELDAFRRLLSGRLGEAG